MFITGIALILAGGSVAGAQTETNAEPNFLSNVRQLTYEGRRSGEGYFSPDGKQIIFQSEREPGNPFYQIYILNLESGDTHRVSPGMGKTTCAFFRPGTDEVLFASTHHDPAAGAKQKAELDFRASGKQRRYSWDYDEEMDIFVARQDGSNIRRLTEAPGYDAEGSYSPDGALIVFSSLRSAYPTNSLSAENRKRLTNDPAFFGEIYTMRADGTDVRRLTDWPGYDGGPFFSPDGTRIIWRHFNEEGTIADVYTMKVDGSDRRRVTDFGAMSWAPYYHPSSEYVIFTANKHGFSNFELFLADAKTTRDPVRITFTDGFDGLPVFSPDGKQVCWASGRTSDGASQLFMAGWNHERALQALRGQRETAPKPTVSTHTSTEAVSNHVAFLASEKLQGRMTGSEGIRAAAEYLSKQLGLAGVQSLSTNATFLQPFQFTAGSKVIAESNALVVGDAAFAGERDFRPLSFTDNGSFTGGVVIAGYGLTVPGKAESAYDSFGSLNVSNKAVLALRYVPEDVSPQRRQELNRYAGLRYKAMQAREHGAKAILFVTGPNSPNAGELIPLSSDGSLAGSGILAVSISSNVATRLLASSGKNLKELQSQWDKEDPHAPAGFDLTNVTVRVSSYVQHIRKEDNNVVGVLPPSRPGDRGEYILVGAHYDHLGFGETGGTLHTGKVASAIHPGADDNASGSAAVLALAQNFAQMPERNRGLIFAFWSGEEMGLLGSAHFAESPPVPLSNIVACVNFDMVGRLRDNKLTLQGIGSSSVWRRLIEKRNIPSGFQLVLQDDPYLPTDVTSFYPKGIPVLNFFTGSHEDYHRPSDTTEKINFDGLGRIIRFAQGIIGDLLTSTEKPAYVRVTRSDSGSGSRETLRAYLGTIPDYSTEVPGVKLSGVRPGGPAERAGLKGGDVIIQFGGQKIANIYDYTYAMDAVKIGQPIAITVLRDGKQVNLSVTPEARK